MIRERSFKADKWGFSRCNMLWGLWLSREKKGGPGSLMGKTFPERKADEKPARDGKRPANEQNKSNLLPHTLRAGPFHANLPPGYFPKCQLRSLRPSREPKRRLVAPYTKCAWLASAGDSSTALYGSPMFRMLYRPQVVVHGIFAPIAPADLGRLRGRVRGGCSIRRRSQSMTWTFPGISALSPLACVDLGTSA